MCPDGVPFMQTQASPLRSAPPPAGTGFGISMKLSGQPVIFTGPASAEAATKAASAETTKASINRVFTYGSPFSPSPVTTSRSRDNKSGCVLSLARSPRSAQHTLRECAMPTGRHPYRISHSWMLVECMMLPVCGAPVTPMNPFTPVTGIPCSSNWKVRTGSSAEKTSSISRSS